MLIKLLCLCLYPHLSGLLCATGPALSPAHQVNNTTDTFSEHWPEHDAHQLGPPEADGLYYGPTSILPGEQENSS